MFLAEAAAAINGSLSGENVEFHSVSTDTRTIKSGDLFIALKGPNFNGHDYIAKAVAAGASGLLVSEAVDANVRLCDQRELLCNLIIPICDGHV